MFGKKKKLEEQPLGYWEESSCFMAIPEKGAEIMSPEQVVKAVSDIDGVQFNYSKMSDDNSVFLVNFNYSGEEFEALFRPGEFSLPDAYLYTMKTFTREETEKLKAANFAMNIFMRFVKEKNSDPKKFFHVQVKLAAAVVPGLVGLIDESAERAFPPKWVKLSAGSKVVSSADDLFNVQAISGESGAVWLHTHGLCRFGLSELEILGSDAENCHGHFSLISAYARYILDSANEFERERPAFIGVLQQGKIPVVVTCVSWTKALSEYGKLELGGLPDREGGHNSKTSPIFIYKSEDDLKKGKLGKVSDYNAIWDDNPIYFFSEKETARMKEVATERIDYVRKAFENKENQVLLKIGLKTDPGSDTDKEHIWFELVAINGDKFRAKLTHEPYNVSGIHTGDEREFSVADITDWLISTPNFPVNPDNVYLLD